MSEKLKRFPGGVDGYAFAALAFHRLCTTRDDQVPMAEIEAAYEALLAKSAGTRFEVWTHEDLAVESLSRGLVDQARNAARLALDLATTGYPAPRARMVLARVGEG